MWFFKFFNEVKNETSKVTWLKGNELFWGVIVVLVVIGIAMLFFLLVDFLIRLLLGLIFKL